MILYTHILTIHLFCYSLTWYTLLLYGERFSYERNGRSARQVYDEDKLVSNPSVLSLLRG